jgi:hypothetical protein
LFSLKEEKAAAAAAAATVTTTTTTTKYNDDDNNKGSYPPRQATYLKLFLLLHLYHQSSTDYKYTYVGTPK